MVGLLLPTNVYMYYQHMTKTPVSYYRISYCRISYIVATYLITLHGWAVQSLIQTSNAQHSEWHFDGYIRMFYYQGIFVNVIVVLEYIKTVQYINPPTNVNRLLKT